MQPLSFTKLSWQEIEKDCLALYPKIKDLKIDRIIAISRGGLVVARIISDLLGSLPISIVTVSSYKTMQQRKKISITDTPMTKLEKSTLLLVDEVSDTGLTFQHATKYLEFLSPRKVYTLSPYIKPHTTFIPDFWTQKYDSWIVFPYDIKETIDAFLKLFTTKEHAIAKLHEIGFSTDHIKIFIKD